MTNSATNRSTIPRGTLAVAVGLALIGCSTGEPARQPSDSSDMASMPGMTPPESQPTTDGSSRPEVSLTASQVQHGGVRWERAQVGDSDAQAAVSLATLPGQLAPDEDRTVRLGAPGEGRVLTVRVSPGDRVQRGRVLVTLRSPMAGMAQSDLAKAKAALTSARAEASYAASARQRAERLLALKAIPRQDYERAIAQDDLARASVAQAEAELERAQSTAATLGADGAVGGELVVRAPIAGVVLERETTPGTVVAAGTPLVVVTDPSNLWLTMSAPEAVIGLLRIGGSLPFTVPAYPGDTLLARLTVIGAGLDAETRTLPLRAVVRNSANRLKPGMLATVSIPTPTEARTDQSSKKAGLGSLVVLPADAVQLVGGISMVFIAVPQDGGGARFIGREVEVGARSSRRVTITRGIAPGEMVVVEGSFAVKAAIEKSKMPKMEM